MSLSNLLPTSPIRGGDIFYIPLYCIIVIVNKYLIANIIVIGYEHVMPSEKPKILFVIDRELLEKLRDYRFENRINSMSEAIRQLLEIGLAAAGKKGARKPPDRDRP